MITSQSKEENFCRSSTAGMGKLRLSFLEEHAIRLVMQTQDWAEICIDILRRDGVCSQAQYYQMVNQANEIRKDYLSRVSSHTSKTLFQDSLITTQKLLGLVSKAEEWAHIGVMYDQFHEKHQGQYPF